MNKAAETASRRVSSAGGGMDIRLSKESRQRPAQRPCNAPTGQIVPVPVSGPWLTFTKAHFGEIVVGEPLMTPRETAKVLRVHTRTVVRLFEEGALLGMEFNAGDSERMTRRIHRGSVCLLLLKTATYAPADYVASVVLFLNSLTVEQCAAVRDAVNWTRQGCAAT